MPQHTRRTPGTAAGALRIGRIDAPALVDQLRALHIAAEDPDVERFPDSDELYGALVYAERHAKALPDPARGEAAVLRVLLWQYLREQADARQLRALEDGRAGGVPWTRFTHGLCVTSKQGAYQRYRRLVAEQVREPGERRTPEVALEHERRALLEAREERARQRLEEARFDIVREAAVALLRHEDDLVLDEDAEYWLELLSEVVDDRRTARERANLVVYLRALADRLVRHAERTGQPAAGTDEALAAIAHAVKVTRPAATG